MRGGGIPGGCRRAALCTFAVGLSFAPSGWAAGERPAEIPTRAPLGVSYSAWKGGFQDAPARLQTFREVGFAIVTFIPAYAYVGRNKVDIGSGPGPDELGATIELALRGRWQVVVKPHLEPLLYRPGYQRATSDNHSWRAECGWRGFFDIDPMTADYRVGVVFAALQALKQAFEKLDASGDVAAPVRLELGAELMNSMVEFPDRWEKLLQAARAERRRLGLSQQVLLSHNFSHHFAIPEDQIDRMSATGRKALARYIAGLDALAMSQYMDLTVALPEDERPGKAKGRLPTAEEVAEALRLHERAFRRDILQVALRLRPEQIPPFHVGEFGVGSGGLRHPNLWGPLGTPEQERQRAQEVARGHEGLVRYLSELQGRTTRSAVLWVTGTHFDIFGWRNPAWAIPAASAAIREYLKR
jgi:hypothetical protein